MRTHRLHGTQQYHSWDNMISRCYRKNNKEYKNYGKRGISVEPKWRTFIGFWEDMGPSYKKGLSIERINNNKGYYKKNCTWATKKQQAHNRRNSIYIDIRGEKILLCEACEQRNLPYHMVYLRINRYKWDVERALSTPSLSKL